VFCGKVKEFLSQNKVDFIERNIVADEAALGELEKLGYMTTPVTVINGDVVVGFDVPKLRALLQLPAGVAGDVIRS
jgi:peroxiredoxin 2/4